MGLLKLLLDTHCWLWLHWQPERLPSPVKRRLRQGSSELLLSAVSVLEIVIKQASGKLRLPQSPESLVSDLLASGVRPLPLALDHATTVGTLPPLHHDPFDRMLVAQALVEDVVLVTADPQILRYPVRTLDARK